MMNNAYSPIYPPRLLPIRLESGKWRVTELGLEALCATCKTYWPADTEFFHSNSSVLSGLASSCKACFIENRKNREKKKNAENLHS